MIINKRQDQVKDYDLNLSNANLHKVSAHEKTNPDVIAVKTEHKGVKDNPAESSLLLSSSNALIVPVAPTVAITPVQIALTVVPTNPNLGNAICINFNAHNADETPKDNSRMFFDETIFKDNYHIC